MIITKEYLDKIEIVPLIDSLKIQKIDDEIYFSKKYNGYISNSRLNLIDPRKKGSPEKFFEGIKPTYNPSFILGTAIHCIILQNEYFELLYDGLEKPTAKCGLIADEYYKYFLKDQSKEYYYKNIQDIINKVGYYTNTISKKRIEEIYNKCINYWNKRLTIPTYNKEQIFLDQKTGMIAVNCINSILTNYKMQELLYPENAISENEQAILLDLKVNVPKHEPFILKLKAKLDNYTIQDNIITVNDVKTLGRTLNEFSKNREAYSYNREIAIYSMLLSLAAKKYYNINKPITKGNYLVVSTVPAYYTKIVSMSKSDFKQGWNEFMFLLKLVALYYANGYRFK